MKKLIPLLVMLAVFGCGKGQDPPAANQDIPFTPEGVVDFYRADSTLITRVIVELAETQEKQAQGLMYRRTLPERGGMLFINTEPSMRSFWMRNTPLPLDIIFVDPSGEIVNIVQRTTPYSEEQILSTEPAQFVVEVRAGFTERHGIDSTAYIVWRRQNFDAAS